MKSRINHFEAAPIAMEHMLEQENYLQAQFQSDHPVTLTIWELVKLRVSQINQCAFCLDMHSKDAVAMGEQSERLFTLDAWKDAPFYSEAERTALAWAETLTAGQAVSDAQFKATQEVFGDKGLIDLTMAVNAINSWNRIAKSLKPEVGHYKAS